MLYYKNNSGKNMNKITRGQIKFIIFKKKGDKLFTGVCLDFGMVIQGKTIDEVKNELSVVSLGYLKTVKKEKLSEDLLNNQAEKKYFDLYEAFLKSAKEEKPLKSAIKSIDECCVSLNNLKNYCYA